MANFCYRGPATDHFDGERFFNPGIASTDKSLADIRRWRRTSVRSQWTADAEPRPQATPPPRSVAIRITMIGHASVLIQVANRNILVDPVWSQRASPFALAGPKRHDRPGIARRDLPPIAAVLLSHNHYDHFDVQTLRWLQADHRPQFVMPLGNDTILRRKVPGARISVGDWHDEIDVSGDSGADVRAVLWPAYHWSSRWLRDRRMALWCGFVLVTPHGPIYVVGDTAYGDGAAFRAVRDRFGPPRVAVIPVGAYEPRWFMHTQHVDPDEAVRIALDCGAAHSLGVHCGTFQLTDEARDEPRRRLDIATAAAGLDGRLPRCGPATCGCRTCQSPDRLNHCGRKALPLGLR